MSVRLEDIEEFSQFEDLTKPVDHTREVVAVFHSYGVPTTPKDENGFNAQCPFDADSQLLVVCGKGRILNIKCHADKCLDRPVAGFLQAWGIPASAFGAMPLEDLLQSMNLAAHSSGRIDCNGSQATQILRNYGHQATLPESADCEVRPTPTSIGFSAIPVAGVAIPEGFKLRRNRWTLAVVRDEPIVETEKPSPLLSAVQSLEIVKDPQGNYFFRDFTDEFRSVAELGNALREQVAAIDPLAPWLDEKDIKNAVRHAIALHSRKAETLNLVSRCGVDEDKVCWLRLADGTFARVADGTWTIEKNCPLTFYTRQGELPFAVPTRGGSRDDMERLYPACMPSRQRVTMTVFALGTLHPSGPYIGLTAQGPKGSSKSVTLRRLASVCDPRSDHGTNASELPAKTDDLMLVGQTTHMPIFDNVGKITKAQSDGCCSLATGGGAKKRKLYTDSDIVVIKTKNPLVIGSIGQVVTEPDLLDRMLVCEFGKLERRKSEAALRDEFNADLRSRIFGYLLSALAAGLHGTDEPDTYHRMADWHHLVSNALGVLGIAKSELDEVLDHQKKLSLQSSADQSPLIRHLEDHCHTWPDGEWLATRRKLSEIILGRVDDELATHAEALTQLGYVITDARDSNRSRCLKFKKVTS